MKQFVTLLFFFLFVSGAFSQTRNVIVNTSSVVVQPTNFWSADASNARTGLGLGSSATNPSSAFQPSSAVLSNLASSNGSSLVNLSVQISNVSGLQSALDGKLATNPILFIGNISNLQTALDGKLGTNPTLYISNISTLQSVLDSKLTASFPLAISNTSGLQASLDGKLGTNPTLTIGNISNLQTALDSKLTTNPTLFIGNISNLQSTLDGKLGTNPTLQISNISLLQTALDSKLTASFPLAISNTYGLQSALDSKLGINPTLSISNISNLQTALDSKLATNPTLFIGNISNLQAALDGKLSTNPTIQISNIASLQTALDSKLTASFPIAISNISGLQAILDGKAATNQIFSISNVNGLQTNLDSKLSLTGNASNLTNFPSTLLRTTGSAFGLTNFPTLNQNTTGTASNVTGVVSIANGGSGANNAQDARNNFGFLWSGLTNSSASTMRIALGASVVGSNIFSLTDPSAIRFLRINADNTVSSLSDSSFRTAIGLGSAATNNTSAFQSSSAVLSNLANKNAADLTNITISNLGTILVTGGGTGATNAATARTNLGLGATWLTNTNIAYFRSDIGLGLSALTNTNTANFRSDIGLGWSALTNTNSSIAFLGYDSSNRVIAPPSITFTSTISMAGGISITSPAAGSINLSGGGFSGSTYSIIGGPSGSTNVIYNGTYDGTNSYLTIYALGTNVAVFMHTNIQALVPLSFNNTSNAAVTRTNLDLGWSALTNTNAGTSLVSVNSNGTVVSPTNFWQVAPIQTLVQTFVPTVSSNSYGTNARNLYVYSMATSISGVTNTIILPTNSATFDGDAATITHKGTTSSVTAVRQAGSATNLTTISNEDESVKFIREAGQWTFYHNISYVEPIRFTDGNIEANKAASRTNLGLGFAALTNTNTTNFQVAIFNTNTAPTNAANFNTAVAWMEINIHTNGTTNSYRIPLYK